LKRKYLFFYGHEGSLSALGNDEVMVQYSMKKRRSWAYDLRRDPEEMASLEASSYPAQLEDLLQFVDDHDASLVRYNAELREKSEPPRSPWPVLLQAK
jgi:hypothetical protein